MADQKITSKDDEEIVEGEDEESKSKKEDLNTKQNEGDDEEDNKGENDDEDEEEEEIPIRKSALQHIVARQSKTIKKLRSQQEEENEEEEFDDQEDDNETDVASEVKKQMEPVLNILVGKVDEDELSDLLRSEPDAKKFEKKIRTYMDNPHYKGVPPSVIYHHLAFDKSASVKDDKKKVADFEAGQNKSSGRSSRNIKRSSGMPTAEEISEMNDEEFEELQNDVMAGKYKK